MTKFLTIAIAITAVLSASADVRGRVRRNQRKEQELVDVLDIDEPKQRQLKKTKKTEKSKGKKSGKKSGKKQFRIDVYEETEFRDPEPATTSMFDVPLADILEKEESEAYSMMSMSMSMNHRMMANIGPEARDQRKLTKKIKSGKKSQGGKKGKKFTIDAFPADVHNKDYIISVQTDLPDEEDLIGSVQSLEEIVEKNDAYIMMSMSMSM